MKIGKILFKDTFATTNDEVLIDFEQIIKSLDLGSVSFKETGQILTVKDGIVEVRGLNSAFSGELVKFESHELGLIMDLSADSVKVVLLGEGLTLQPGQSVYRENRLAGFNISDKYLGRISDSLGKFTDGGKVEVLTEEDYYQYRNLDVKAPGIIIRQKVSEPVYTGLLVIDSMIPIGRGQRELIIGDRLSLIHI